MLMQNFQTADQLGLTEQQRDALIKTLVLLETGKLTHVSASGDFRFSDHFTGHFNMDNWNRSDACGTICCIGGTAELVGHLPLFSLNILARRDSYSDLFDLFCPQMLDWEEITTAQAATALRAFLTTGKADWRNG